MSSEPTKELRTAEDGCPKSGVVVTVYGNPWSAMLRFEVAAGPVRNKAELQTFFEIITERLQRLYDVVA
jgi:hypothetical protein